MEGLRKQLGKLDERARSKEQDLDDTLSKLEAFYKAYDSVMDDVTEVSTRYRYTVQLQIFFSYNYSYDFSILGVQK